MYSGQSKLECCRRIVADWQDLADYFLIAPSERARFERGREPHGVWEWLEKQRRLHELPKALALIGRKDLLEVLTQERTEEADPSQAWQPYRQAIMQQWSHPRYELDKRFVALPLLLDQGAETQGVRWQAAGEPCQDLQ